MKTALWQKYNLPIPRYTSYPTVPYWEESTYTPEKWMEALSLEANRLPTKEGISLYIHLPFCEKLCTFCGCNKHITKNHSVEEVYIRHVLREWEMYVEKLPSGLTISEMHLGGGSPSFFSAEHLAELIEGILEKLPASASPNFGWEANPQNTTGEQLQALYRLGFRRVSFGIQDMDPEVQRVINRVQTEEQIREVTFLARSIGYTSVNFDLVYGLPKQTKESIQKTFLLVNQLAPERIAYYSYAHVPWVKGVGQRLFTENDLPDAATKRSFYEIGRGVLEANGYTEIGMDHFALAGDPLFDAMQAGTLHRNFMGYTETRSSFLIGLGVSAISDIGVAFSQNLKTVKEYELALSNNQLPAFKGHIHSVEDTVVRRHVTQLMCQFQTDWHGLDADQISQITERLSEMQKDGLVLVGPSGVQVTRAGRGFVRNICHAFDLRLWRAQPTARIFSMAV